MPFEAPGNCQNGTVLDIMERDGKLWLATDGGGINVYDKISGSVTVIDYIPGKPFSLPVSSFYCLYNDSDNNIWAGEYQRRVDRNEGGFYQNLSGCYLEFRFWIEQ